MSQEEARRDFICMYSDPNHIPLNAPAIRRIMECLDPLA
jgi:hypothetical protein